MRQDYLLHGGVDYTSYTRAANVGRHLFILFFEFILQLVLAFLLLIDVYYQCHCYYQKDYQRQYIP